MGHNIENNLQNTDIQIKITQEQRCIILAALYGFYLRASNDFDRDRYYTLLEQFKCPDNSKKAANLYLFNEGRK
jgi:hypothetical protein